MTSKSKLAFAVLLIGRIALAGIFLAAGYFKLREPWLQFAVSLSSFKILPDEWLELVAKTLPWAEVVLGVAILSGILLRWTALISTLILTVFLSVLTRSYLMGIHADCGCFGSGEPLGPKTLARDSTMLILSLAVMIGAFLVQRRTAQPKSAQTAESASVS